MKDDIAIEVKNVSKDFILPHKKRGSIKSFFVNPFSKFETEKQHALSGVSFTIKKGEFFGIVGRNGSGKSTLLKCMAGVYAPDKGEITINGSLVPFIELGVGFNPELSGRDNVYLNGALLGFNRKELDAMYQEIVDFAELEKFMDQKLKNYSSGMQVRLAFSISIKAHGDILLLDEVLAVGDEAFQRKCFEYFALLKNERKTVILVTHSMESVQRFCNTAMLLDSGEVVHIGNSMDVAEGYRMQNQPKEEVAKNKINSGDAKHKQLLSTKIVVDGEKETKTITGKNTYIKFINTITTGKTINDAFFGFTIRKQSGELVYWYTSEQPNKTIGTFHKGKPVTVSLKLDNIFGEDTYVVSLYLKSNNRTHEHAVVKNAIEFKIVNRGTNGSMLHPNISVETIK